MAGSGGERILGAPPRPGLIRGGVAVSLLLHGAGLAACLWLLPPTHRSPPAITVTLVAARALPSPPRPAPAVAASPVAVPPSRVLPPPRPAPPPERPRPSVRHRVRPVPRPALRPVPAVSIAPATPPAAPPAAIPVSAASSPSAGGGAFHPARTAGAVAVPGRAVLQDYLRRVHGLLQAHLLYPQAARSLGLSGVVVVRFTITADGRVGAASLAVVGGVDAPLLRQEALAAVRAVQPLPPPPRAPMTVQVPVAFRRS